MIVYMLRNNLTGKYYCRGPGNAPLWRVQEEASVWTSKRGPHGAKHKAGKGRRYLEKVEVDLEIVSFKMVEDK
jgi:predicted GIY-YIG superfamily endonuclease